MTPILHDVSREVSSLSLAPSGAARRMVVGVTHEQTCLVLRRRLRTLREAGFAVTLVSSPGELLERTAKEEEVAVSPVKMRRGISPAADLWSFFVLLRLLARLRPDITDFSTPKAGLLGNVAAWVLRVPHRVYTLRGLKLEASRGLKRRLLLWSERIAAGCAHVVLCNSETLQSAARVLGIAPDEKLRLLGNGSSNGVDAERFSPAIDTTRRMRRSMGYSDEEVVLGFVGRLTGDKGVPELLIAFDQILHVEPRCRLLLVGWFDSAEDALDLRWRMLIASHPRILHTGFVLDTAPYYRAMDLMVLPTHREGFPNVALEAAACGLPVITTESTGARDAVLANLTGLLIPAGIPEAIVEASLELIRDGAKRRRMGEAGRRWVIEQFSSERVLGLAVEFYRDLPGSKD